MSGRVMRAIGVDVGTSSLKATRVRVDHGAVTIEAVATRSYGRSGRPTRDPSVWVATARGAIGELRDRGTLDALGFTGQMHALVPVAGGRPQAPAKLWLDYDGRPELDAFCRAHPELPLLERTGNIPLPDFTLAKWLRFAASAPDVAVSIDALPAAKDHVRDAFATVDGQITDVNEASGTQWHDPFSQGWDEAICRAAGIPSAVRARIVTPATVVGATTGHSMPSGVPVVAGTGDQAAAARGLGADVAGRASLSLGTSGVLSVPWRLHGMPADWDGAWHLFPTDLSGAFQVIATIPALSGSLHWAAGLLGTDLAGLVRLAGAARRRSAGAVRFFPYLGGSGAPHPDVSQRGQLRGLSEATTRADVAGSVVSGAANELACLVMETRALGVPIAEVVLSGGLAGLDPLVALIAARLDVPTWRSSVAEASAVGAALLGLDGVGVSGHPAGAGLPVRVRATDRTSVDETWRMERETILAAAGE